MQAGKLVHNILNCCSGYIWRYMYIPYGRKFWRGIYFGGLAVLRAIRQYFIRQISAQCDVIIIAKSYQCVYTRPAARRASLIVAIEFTIKAAYEDITSPKSLLYPGGRRAGLSVKARKAIQATCTRSCKDRRNENSPE